jgi:Cu+-exporting ATPase
MNTTKTEAKDPICGMTVETATSLHAERDGETFYFCSEHCREKFVSAPTDAKPDKKSGGCGGG